MLKVIFLSVLFIYAPFLQADEKVAQDIQAKGYLSIHVYTEYLGEFYVDGNEIRDFSTPNFLNSGGLGNSFMISNLQLGMHHLSQKTSKNGIVACDVNLKNDQDASVKFFSYRAKPEIEYERYERPSNSWWGRMNSWHKLNFICGIVAVPLVLGFLIMASQSKSGG